VKKDRYFTLQNIYQKSLNMLSEVEEFRSRHEQSLAPERAALLVLDMQRYFLEESSHAFIPSSEAIVPNIQRLLTACSKAAMPVIFTRHVNSEADAGMMARWWQDLIRRDDPASEIIPELDIGNETVIEKNQYDAFYKTGLETMLHEQRITQVIICGVTTHLCCETTARSAFTRGFEVFFVIDATASYNDAFHRATLLNLSHGFAVPVLIEEVVAAVDNKNAH